MTFSCPLCHATTSSAVLAETIHGTVFHVVRCTSCHLIQTFPQPDAAAIAQLYSQGYGQTVSGAYCSEGQFDVRNHQLALGVIARQRPAGSAPLTILDVGCGAGNFLDIVQSSGHHGYGLELSPVAYAASAARFPGRIHQGVLDETAFPGQTFDAITFWYVMEHVTDPPAVLRSALGRLNSGGFLIIAVPNWRYIAVRRWLQRLTGRTPTVDPHEHLFQFTWTTVDRMCQQAGLEIFWKAIPTPYPVGSRPVRLAKAIAFGACRVMAALTGFRFGGIMLAARKP
jgi:SAM-dependent methyltransferase